MTDAIVKNLSFGDDARKKVFTGIEKLTNAVSSTLGASGKCVMLEDSSGRPIITKDGVTVADSIILLDPVENMGATLLKEAARKTVREAGDGTTTATVLAHSILKTAYDSQNEQNSREIKEGIEKGVDKVCTYLENISTKVKDKMIDQIATISTNNDPILGGVIGDAFRSVGDTGIVMMETSEDGNTFVEIVDGVQYEKSYVDQIDPETIESVNVINDSIAIKEKGIEGLDSIIEITLKK